jgi:hypothetical protein
MAWRAASGTRTGRHGLMEVMVTTSGIVPSNVVGLTKKGPSGH